MFTAQSEHNQGGLRQITQSPYEAKRMKQYMNDGLVVNQNLLMTGNDFAGQPSAAMFGTSQAPIEANKTPNLSKQRMEPFRLNFQSNQNQRPTSST